MPWKQQVVAQKGFSCRGSAPELGNEWTVLLAWGRVRSAANGSPATAAA